MNVPDPYSVQLTGPGLNYTREISESNAHELLIWLLKGGKLPAVASHPSIESANTSAGATDHSPNKGSDFHSDVVTSVREFVDEFEPKRGPDKIASFALYLREHRNRREFTRDEIVTLFQESAEPVPKNLGRDLKWTQSIGWIATSATDRSSFYLTKRGEEATRGHFSKEILARTRQASTSGRRRNGGKPSVMPEASTSETAD